MADIFLETTAVVYLVFGDSAKKDLVNGRIPSNCQLITSRYVIYETNRGYLRYLRLLHNKSVQLKRFSELFSYASSLFRMPSYQGAIHGAMERYFQHSHPALSDQDRLFTSEVTCEVNYVEDIEN
jgi:hypothetical protein